MEMIVLDTLGKLYRHGHGLFGWCAPSAAHPSGIGRTCGRGVRPGSLPSKSISRRSSASAVIAAWSSIWRPCRARAAGLPTPKPA